MDISKIDKNFCSYYSFEGMRTYDVNDNPFTLYGLCREDCKSDFKRLPHSLAEKIDNNSIKALYKNTAGIRVRFRTDSKQIILKCVFPKLSTSSTMPLTGSSCFDLYADGKYCSVFRPAIDINGKFSTNTMEDTGYTSGYVFPEKEMREILIHFPLYNDVDEVYIALEEGATLLETKGYKNSVPIVFYGSSITQGGCASHAGNCYSAIISRRLGCDYINLGFSAGCFAEKEMCEYISELEKSVLVYDYDHNAETAEFLENTHERFFKQLREKNPCLPVVMISAADDSFGKEAERRKKIIKKTFENAKIAGDNNVYYIDGSEIYKSVGTEYCTVDGIHPNDHGFFHMANVIGDIIKSVIEK